MNILVVEDERDQRELIVEILKSHGHNVSQADCVEDAIVQLKSSPLPDVIFSDWKLGSLTGMNLLDYVKANQHNVGFVVATAYGSVQHAVEAIENGADDYLSKPFQSTELLLAITKANTAKTLRQTNNQLSSQLTQQQQMVDLVGNAPCMQQVYERIKRVSNTSATVLINGESGTGKELAARALHQLSARKDKPFIAINCGAIPESLAEAELFGAEKGAFTGAIARKIGKIEAADQGTLFLDEIGELPIQLQAKLLRFLQEGVINRIGNTEEMQLDVRVIAATHRDIPKLITENLFREDLYYRLNVVPIMMPALRERQEDIPSLVHYFLQKFEQQYQCDSPSMSKETQKLLYDHHWPGNVRELSNKIERFVLLGDENELIQEVSKPQSNKDHLLTNELIPEQGLVWEEVEKRYLTESLFKCNNNKSKAAELLGMNYKQFLYRLEKFKL